MYVSNHQAHFVSHPSDSTAKTNHVATHVIDSDGNDTGNIAVTSCKGISDVHQVILILCHS
jgi:hypothetical protein